MAILAVAELVIIGVYYYDCSDIPPLSDHRSGLRKQVTIESMKDTFSTGFGCGCAWISVLCSLMALFQAGLTAYCLAMMDLDRSADHNWNCGVLIYGSQFLVLSGLAFTTFLLASWLLKGNCWQFR